MRNRVLVAGVGNLFRCDDAFGAEVAMRLSRNPLPEGVQVRDFGVGAVHLAYELMDGVDDLVLVDACPRGSAPGTVYVIEPDLDDVAPADEAADVLVDAHSFTPDAVLHLVARLRAGIGRIRVVGCEPLTVDDGMGLSEPVAAAVDEAVGLVRRLVDEALAQSAGRGRG